MLRDELPVQQELPLYSRSRLLVCCYSRTSANMETDGLMGICTKTKALVYDQETSLIHSIAITTTPNCVQERGSPVPRCHVSDKSETQGLGMRPNMRTCINYKQPYITSCHNIPYTIMHIARNGDHEKLKKFSAAI